MGSDPLHHIGHAAHDVAGGDMRAINHDDGQAKGAGGGDLGHGTLAPGVFRDDDFSAMVMHQGGVIGHRKGAACDDEGGVRQGQCISWWIDEAQEIMVLGGGRKGRKVLPPDGQKHAARGWAKGCGGAAKIGHMLPAVFGRGLPWRAFEGEQGGACGLGSEGGIRAHLGGEGVGGVNDVGDGFGGDVGLQPCDAAKAAGARGQGLGVGCVSAAGVGIDRIGVIIMQSAGKQASLGDAAKQKDAHDV